MQINKITVYTCITGDYDKLLPPLFVDQNTRYVCFTNNKNLTSDFWEIELIENPLKLDNVRLARYVKTNPHQFVHTAYSMWIDGNLQITASIYGILNHVIEQDVDFLTIKHPHCIDIYGELLGCIFHQKDSPEVMARQVYDYRTEGLPDRTGQCETNMIIRKNDAKMTAFGNLWFEEIKTKSRRDQLSFMYVYWKLKKPFKLGQISVKERNTFIKLSEHS